MEATLTGISSMLFVNFLLPVVCLYTLQGVRSYGCHHGLRSRLGLLELFVFSICLTSKAISYGRFLKPNIQGIFGPQNQRIILQVTALS